MFEKIHSSCAYVMSKSKYVKINYDKPAFYVDELITGNLILISEKTSIIEKIVVRIVLIQQWKTEYDIPKRKEEPIKFLLF